MYSVYVAGGSKKPEMELNSFSSKEELTSYVNSWISKWKESGLTVENPYEKGVDYDDSTYFRLRGCTYIGEYLNQISWEMVINKF